MEIKDYPTDAITTPENIASIIQAILKREATIDQDKEHFWTIGLDTANRIKYIELVTLGILNSTLIHPREVFRLAVMQGVATIILVHNHPSGNLKPSEGDQTITQNLIEAGKILAIKVMDHILIGKDWKPGYNNYYSWKEEETI